MSGEYEHDEEAVRGLPGHLPPGEKILWQGKPQWRTLARKLFHTRWVLAYFGILMIWRVFESAWTGEGAVSGMISALWLVPVAAAAIGILGLLAWAIGRSTVYTITNRRVVIRAGVAIPKCVNLPFAKVGSAALRTYENGDGNIAIDLSGKDRIAYLHLWPHVRPWRFAGAQPMLRSVPDAAGVARTLAEALAEATGEEVQGGAGAPAESRPDRRRAEDRSYGGGTPAFAGGR